MNFIDLPEYLSCSVAGVNSPVIIRAEAGCEAGGMVVEEYQYTLPNIHLYGDTKSARAEFRRALIEMRTFVTDVESKTVNWEESFPYIAPTWFHFEIRQREYRAVLWGDEKTLDFSWMGSKDDVVPDILVDLGASFNRLKDIYERFFDTSLDQPV